MKRIESRLQVVYTLAAAHWIIARPAPRGWVIVEMRETRTELLDTVASRDEADVLAQTYAVLVAARLTGAM